MPTHTRVVLTSFQGGLATLEVHYSGRHARLQLDQLEDRYAGQPTGERAGEELARIVEALSGWLNEKSNRIIEGQ